MLFPYRKGDKLSGFLQSVLGTAEANLDKVEEKLE